MSTRVNLIYGLAAGMLLSSLPTIARPTPKKAAEETAVIENSGSTNTASYQIIVSSRGSASYREIGAESHVRTVAKAVTAKLFTDLSAAMPLKALPVRHGMRSASFGTETYITYKGQKSPDLTTPSGPLASALHEDVKAIEAAVHALSHPRRRTRE